MERFGYCKASKAEQKTLFATFEGIPIMSDESYEFLDGVVEYIMNGECFYSETEDVVRTKTN